MKLKSICLVCFDHDGVSAAFTSEEEAKAHCAELNQAGVYAYYNVYSLDPSPRERLGAYCLEWDDNGVVVYDGWVDWCMPDEEWGQDFIGAHSWEDGSEGGRAVGIDRAEAESRMKAFLKKKAGAGET